MEDILEQRICKHLSQMYNKNNIQQVMRIFFLRCMIYYNKPEVNTAECLDFLIRELNLPDCDMYEFEGEKISKKYIHNPYSFENIMDNLIFSHMETLEKNEIGEIVLKRDILKKIFMRYKDVVDKKYKYEKKSSPYYKERYCYSLLQELYKDFSLNISPPTRIKGLKYPPNHNDSSPTFDEYCQRYYLYYKSQNKKLTEEELEQYLCLHPEAFDIDGFKIIKRQYKVNSGVVDLIGQDADGNKFLVELKVSKRPKDLMWQLRAYKDDLEKIYKEEIYPVAVTPPLDESILIQLKKMNCRLYYFYLDKDELVLKRQVL